MSLVDQLRGDEVASLVSEVGAGRRDHILKSLDERGRAQELVRQQYSGRYPFELLQNANDAAADGNHPGRVRFVLTDTALLIADNGAGFGPDQVRAICGLGRSSKDPRKSVGYKGLGFKSVGEITARPQIVSAATAFEFDERRVREVVEAAVGPIAPGQRLPVYAFPFPIGRDALGDDAKVVDKACSEGFTTVLRLPLRADVPRSDVEAHLVDALVPRLLLFLLAIEELELRGTGSDFLSVVSRDKYQENDEVLLETSKVLEHWLVYRRGHDVDRSLVAPLGDAWAEVEQVHVAVAVPLNPEGRPTAGSLYPLHVYFPTQERTGLPVIVQGDFALQLDRRQLATNPEALPYNDFLLDAAASLLGRVVAPILAKRYPSDAAPVQVLTPRAAPTGVGMDYVRRYVDVLRRARYLPGIDGRARLAAEALVLPKSVPEPSRAHDHLDLSDLGRLLIPGIEEDTTVRAFLVERLGVVELSLDEALQRLTRPEPDATRAFYALLVDWADACGTRQFATALSGVRCLLTVGGDWVKPSRRVFAPRRRDDVDVPVDLPVPIIAVPEIDGLASLLTYAGVSAFEWRDLVTDFLLPLLTVLDTEPTLRERALKGLHAYYLSQRGGDQTVRRRILDVLLPARSAIETNVQLRPAGTLYFGSEWSGSSALERLYGPFGQAEFLALEPPPDSEQRLAEHSFLRWIGVADYPRVLEAHGDQRDTYMTDGLSRHPHRTLGAWWESWWSSEAVASARVCSQGHPFTQRLRSSFILDRFQELAVAGDPERALVLWNELAHHWGAVYEPATRAVFHCQHTGHGGERDRTAPSLFMHMLATAAWVPAQKAGNVIQVRPRDAWRLALDTPRWVAKRVPVIDTRMSDGVGVALATALSVTDAARPSPAPLVDLLRDLSSESGATGELTREIQVASRWAMRTLNDALADPSASAVRDVPLLARYRGQPVFTKQPVVAIDPLLAETWEQHYPILDADRDLRRLHQTLGLRVLDDPDTGVAAIPVPRGPRNELRAEVEAMVNRAKPFLAAVSVANTPSREDEVLRGLARLEIMICDELILRYTFEGKTIDRKEAVSYIAVRQESGRGAIRRNIATAHLEIDPQTQRPDWYAFGPQLAQFLNVPTLGDSFAMILSGTDHDRRRYLASRRVPLDAVDAMRVLLELPPEDELPGEIMEFIQAAGRDLVEGRAAESPIDEPISEPPVTADKSERDDSGGSEPIPDLRTAEVTITDARAGIVLAAGRGAGGGGGLGPTGSIDFDQLDRQSREIGARGERAALAAEKRRVVAFGGDPEAVVWRSERNSLAPYDIESLDEDGQRIYIEVKSTTSDDPGNPFYVSHAELLHALRHRSRFYIYRVTSVLSAAPHVDRFQDPIGLLLEGRADLRLSDARLALGRPGE